MLSQIWLAAIIEAVMFLRLYQAANLALYLWVLSKRVEPAAVCGCRACRQAAKVGSYQL